METSMFDKMQSLPLLQGLTLQEFSNLIVNMKLDFKQHDEGDIIINQGDRCTSLIYIINGEFEVEYHNSQATFVLSETCNSVPYLIESYNMFGVKRSYERTYSFKSKGDTFNISREFFIQRLLTNEFVRGNYINYICNYLRKIQDCRKTFNSTNIEDKMVTIIENYCLFAEGEKNIRIKMNDFAEMIDETRLNVSGILNKWSDKDLIELRRYGFTIKNIKELLIKTP